MCPAQGVRESLSVKKTWKVSRSSSREKEEKVSQACAMSKTLSLTERNGRSWNGGLLLWWAFDKNHGAFVRGEGNEGRSRETHLEIVDGGSIDLAVPGQEGLDMPWSWSWLRVLTVGCRCAGKGTSQGTVYLSVKITHVFWRTTK